MIFPINKSKYKIIECIYENKRIKISELLKKTNVSQKIGYEHIGDLLKSEIITEELEGKKPLLRLFKPNLKSETGKICFSLIELQKKAEFFKKHPKLKPAFIQFENETKHLINSALIFGSFARVAETKESDIDLTIIADEIINKKLKRELEKISERCFVTLKNRVSIRIFKKADFKKSDELISQIIKNHIVIVNSFKWIETLSEA